MDNTFGIVPLFLKNNNFKTLYFAFILYKSDTMTDKKVDDDVKVDDAKVWYKISPSEIKNCSKSKKFRSFLHLYMYPFLALQQLILFSHRQKKIYI